MQESEEPKPIRHGAGLPAKRQWTEEQDRLYAALEATSDGIVLFDHEGRLLLANLAFRKFFGLIPDGLAHENPAATLEFLKSRATNPVEFERSFRELLLHPEVTERDTVELKLPYPRILLRIRTPVRDGASAVIGQVHTLRDVTVEREIAQTKSEFVSTVSHELRTPLTSIKGALQLVMQNPQELLPFQQELLTICLRNAERLIRLVSDVLDISRIEAGKLALKLSGQMVSDLVEHAMTGVSALASERQIAIEVRLPPDLPTVQADQDRIVQVLTNLLSNAIKFSMPAGCVRVVAELRRTASDDEDAIYRSEGADRAIAISVIDQGRGIAREDLDTLFVPFHQLDRSAAREASGTGLGLAICKGIVEEHGGRIWACSEGLGLGTTVTFLLPVEGPPRRHLLVADDDPLFVSLMTEILGSAGYLVTSALDGETTLQMIEQAMPDLLLLDLLLPGVDGWEILRILRAQATTRDLPILAITSLGALDAERTLALGADDYLSKPISVSVLTDTVNRLIATAERRRREAEAEKVAEELLSARPAAGGQAERVRPRILIVEDNPVNMELMMELLERGRYEIHACGDGREMMRLVKVHRPDLILLDINLPHIDGLTLTRMLREDPETRPVTIVAISAYSVAGDEEQILQAGCDGFISKPIDTRSFLQTISMFLARGISR